MEDDKKDTPATEPANEKKKGIESALRILALPGRRGLRLFDSQMMFWALAGALGAAGALFTGQPTHVLEINIVMVVTMLSFWEAQAYGIRYGGGWRRALRNIAWLVLFAVPVAALVMGGQRLLRAQHGQTAAQEMRAAAAPTLRAIEQRMLAGVIDPGEGVTVAEGGGIDAGRVDREGIVYLAHVNSPMLLVLTPSIHHGVTGKPLVRWSCEGVPMEDLMGACP